VSFHRQYVLAALNGAPAVTVTGMAPATALAAISVRTRVTAEGLTVSSMPEPSVAADAL
jgi:hypothetical protein